MHRPGIPRWLRQALVVTLVLTSPRAARADAAPAGLSDVLTGSAAAHPGDGTDRSLEYSAATGVPLIGGAIASAFVPRAIYRTPPPCRWCNGADPNAVDRWARQARWSNPCPAARMSYWSLGLAAAVTMGPSIRETRGEDWLDNAGTVVDSVAATVILTQIVKYTVRRERPSESVCHARGKTESDRNLSFFSGHTAIAFALVSSAREVARLRGKEPSDWLWAGGFAAAATGYLRVAGDRHHLIDVVTGAAVGSLVGRWVPRHLHRGNPPASSRDPSSPISTPRSLTSPFQYSRPITSGNRTFLLQVGPGPGRSLQLGLSF